MAKMTVVELKQRIRPGVKLQSVHTGTGPYGADHPFYTEIATVRRVMATQFTVNRPFKGDNSESYCTFPKASQLEATDGGFRITIAPNMILEYRFMDDEYLKPCAHGVRGACGLCVAVSSRAFGGR